MSVWRRDPVELALSAGETDRAERAVSAGMTYQAGMTDRSNQAVGKLLPRGEYDHKGYKTDCQIRKESGRPGTEVRAAIRNQYRISPLAQPRVHTFDRSSGHRIQLCGILKDGNELLSVSLSTPRISTKHLLRLFRSLGLRPDEFARNTKAFCRVAEDEV